jgi:hypothetical protein
MRIMIATTIALIATIANASQFDGKYRLNQHWDCKIVGMDGGAIRISGTKFEEVESSCSMTRPTKVRDMDAVLYDLNCSGEGETWSERVMIMKQQNGIAIIRRGSVGEWQLCP